jgi:hypothetical protein
MIVASTLSFLAVNGKVSPSFILLNTCRRHRQRYQLDASGTQRLTKGDLVNMVLDNEKHVGKFSDRFSWPDLC